MKRLRVGYDLDGPGYGFMEAVAAYRHQADGIPLDAMPLPQPGSVYEAWGVTLPELVDCINRGVNAGFIFRHGDPEPGFVQSIRDVFDAGHEVHIITARAFGDPGVCEKSTREWLAQHGAPFHSLTFSADKTCLRTDLMAEDDVSNYERLAAAGTQAWLVNKEWNKPWDDGRRRIASMEEFTEKVNAAALEAA